MEEIFDIYTRDGKHIGTELKSVCHSENQYNHLIYKGCDFIGFNQLSNEIINKANKYAKIIGEDLQKQGYLGICGIDFIIYDNEVFLLK